MRTEKTHDAPKWPRSWPLIALSVPATVTVWSGWVGLGEMTGYGPVKPLPGIWQELVINTAVTLPFGVEAFAVLAMSAWFSSAPLSVRTRRTAMAMAGLSALLGMAGQVGYHLLAAKGAVAAPGWLTMFVSVLPVMVIVAAGVLLHMVRADKNAYEMASGQPWPVAGGHVRTWMAGQLRRAMATRTADSGQPDGQVAIEAASRTDGQADSGHGQRPRTAASRTDGQADSGHVAKRTRANGRMAAREILAKEPGLSGDELAVRLGVSGRTGRRIKDEIIKEGNHS